MDGTAREHTDPTQALLTSLGVHDVPRRCRYPGCTAPLPVRQGRGRPTVYCSRVCRAKMDRDRRTIRRALQRAENQHPDTTAGQTAITHVRLLASQYGLDGTVSTPTPSTPTPEPWRAPPTTLSLRWYQDRQHTVVTQPFRLPFELYAALRDAEAVAKTAERTIHVLLEHEKRQPSIRRESQYQMGKILDRFVSIIEHLRRIVYIPEKSEYEGLMLNVLDGEIEYCSDAEWLVRTAERDWYNDLVSDVSPWPIPETPLLAVRQTNREPYTERNRDVAEQVLAHSEAQEKSTLQLLKAAGLR